MQTSDRSAQLYQKIGGIIEAGNLNLDHVDESLNAAVLMGAKISSKSLSLALDATARIIHAEPLTAKHEAILESIILGNGLRPAYDIARDSFDQLPSVWSDLNDARADLTPVIRSVGRLNVSGHPKVSYAGTAFVCGVDLLLTNRHVAEEFMKAGSSDITLEFKPGMSAVVDLKQEVGSNESILLEPTGEATISMEWDVALLKVKSLPAEIAPVRLAAVQPSAIKDKTAAVIGYPAFDENENLIEQIAIFRGLFNKKRLQPGKFLGIGPVMSYGRNVTALMHDCSTLGGNSGAAVVDVESHKVLGVHFCGISGVANYCIPSWELARTEAFTSMRGKMSFC
ncbi:MAG: serine protease [Deltaproteobacteria bacterium]|nr:serine protease [Deltaproteobacteria bacterium]